MYIYGNGLIKCLNCGSTFRGKKQRNKVVYICNTYNKLGNDGCPRHVLEEEDITYTISKHLALQGKKIDGDIQNHVKSIEVQGKGYTVVYKDGSKSLINAEGEYGVKVKY
jgi:D-alanine-D-alanine ligase-like ATP-grasp enzyme